MLYKINDEYYRTLIEMVKEYPKEWEDAIKQEAGFWGELCIIDLLAESSDVFEEILADEGLYLESVSSLELEEEDLNVLLAPLWE